MFKDNHGEGVYIAQASGDWRLYYSIRTLVWVLITQLQAVLMAHM